LPTLHCIAAELTTFKMVRFATSSDTDEWVESQFVRLYCDENGVVTAPKVNFGTFRDMLRKRRPEEGEEINEAVKS